MSMFTCRTTRFIEFPFFYCKEGIKFAVHVPYKSDILGHNPISWRLKRNRSLKAIADSAKAKSLYTAWSYGKFKSITTLVQKILLKPVETCVFADGVEPSLFYSKLVYRGDWRGPQDGVVQESEKKLALNSSLAFPLNLPWSKTLYLWWRSGTDQSQAILSFHLCLPCVPSIGSRCL